MITRKKYLDKLIAFQNADLVKVVTGVRRCGKSTLLEMMRQHLSEQGVPDSRLLMFKMESMEFADVVNYRDLYNLVRQRVGGEKRPYLFSTNCKTLKAGSAPSIRCALIWTATST